MNCPICNNEDEFKFIEKKWEYKIYQCPRCDGEFSDPMKTTSEAYEKMGTDIIDKRISFGYRRRNELAGSYLGWDHQKFLPFLEAQYKVKDNVKIIEIGCGTGDFVNMLSKQGWNITGFDLDKKVIEIGRKYHNLNNIYYEDVFQVIDGNKTKHDMYDIVCFFAVLEHLESPGTFIENVKKLLKGDGIIAFSVPNGESRLQKIYRRLTRYIDYPPQHLTRWKGKTIDVFLEKHGFKKILYETSQPSITDIASDMIKLFTPTFISSKTMMKIQSLSYRYLTKWLDGFAPMIDKKGRSQLVIARRNN